MMYATVARSFKSGGFNPISENSPLLTPEFGGNPGNAFFDPEFIDSFEVGVKTTLLDGALRINAAGFYYDYSDFQQSQIVNVTSKNVNADAEITGLELDVAFAITPNLIATFSGGWLDTEIGEFWSVDTANPYAATQAELAANPLSAIAPAAQGDGTSLVMWSVLIITGVMPLRHGVGEDAWLNPCYSYMQNQKGNQMYHVS